MSRQDHNGPHHAWKERIAERKARRRSRFTTKVERKQKIPRPPPFRAPGHPIGLHVLARELDALITTVDETADSTLVRWHPRIKRLSFRGSAENLARYLALRQHDLSGLQERLSELGLSSLGRSEARVKDSLAAISATIGLLNAKAEIAYPPQGWSRRGADLLMRNTEQIFGLDPTGPRTRIMVTLPPEAAETPTLARELIEAGADCARINCAHDDPATWLRMISHVRAASELLGRDCKLLMDLAGPKCRIMEISQPEMTVEEGEVIEILGSLAARSASNRKAFSISYDTAVGRLAAGQRISIDDGKLDLIVEHVFAGGVAARVARKRTKRGRLRPGKGVNFPDLDLDMPALTAKDLADLDVVIEHADIVGYSFVQTPGDIVQLRSEMRRRLGKRPLPALLLKIETRRAVDNLPELIVEAAGHQSTAVMIARGDLAVEVGLDRLCEHQEQILWLCEAAHVPVVWATQVLEGLVRKRNATRAEATDAALAQRAECVMLNKGPHLVEAVRFLDDILRRMDRHVLKKSPVLGSLSAWRTADARGDFDRSKA